MMTKTALLVYLSAVVIGSSGASSPAHSAYGDPTLISADGHQAIKAKVLNADPQNFTINVKYMANMGVNENAPTFAVYTSAGTPKQCADFSSLALKYDKPEKYHRKFNLSSNMDVLKAIETHQCVVIKNIPSQ